MHRSAVNRQVFCVIPDDGFFMGEHDETFPAGQRMQPFERTGVFGELSGKGRCTGGLSGLER